MPPFSDFLKTEQTKRDLENLFKSNNETISTNETEIVNVESSEEQQIITEPIIISQETIKTNIDIDTVNKYLDKFPEEQLEEATTIPANKPMGMIGGGLGPRDVYTLINLYTSAANFNNKNLLSSTNINDAIIEVYDYSKNRLDNLDDANIICNASGLDQPNPTVKDAIEYLHTEINELALSAGAVVSVFGRAGMITAYSGDYNANQISYNATTVSATLTNLTNSLSAYAILNNSATFSAMTVGTSSNYTSFDNTGFLQQYGSACSWFDITIPATSINPTGTADPAQIDNNDGSIYFRGNNQDTIAVWFQLPHGYDVGTNIHPHIHWSPIVAINNSHPNFQIKHKEGPVGGIITDFTTLTSGTSIYFSSAVNSHNIIEFPSISGTTSAGQQLGISSIICLYIERITPDSYGTSDVRLLSVDIHVQEDTTGSRQEFTK